MATSVAGVAGDALTRSQSAASGSAGVARVRISSRVWLPSTAIAVPGSLTAGDSARCAISARTMSP